MITPVAIPKLTLTMEGGTITRWLKQEGDHVEKDETLFELETDKVLVEVGSPTAGFVRSILIADGEAAVGTVVGFIGEATDVIPLTSSTFSEEATPPPKVGDIPRPQGEGPIPGIIRASPAARRRAKELGVDLAKVQGTGPDGRISQEDVESVLPPSESS